MSQAIKTVAALYQFDNGLFPERIGGLTNDQVMKRVSDSANPILWIAGHLAGVRFHLTSLLGGSNGEGVPLPTWAKLNAPHAHPTPLSAMRRMPT